MHLYLYLYSVSVSHSNNWDSSVVDQIDNIRTLQNPAIMTLFLFPSATDSSHIEGNSSDISSVLTLNLFAISSLIRHKILILNFWDLGWFYILLFCNLLLFQYFLCRLQYKMDFADSGDLNSGRLECLLSILQMQYNLIYTIIYANPVFQVIHCQG